MHICYKNVQSIVWAEAIAQQKIFAVHACGVSFQHSKIKVRLSFVLKVLVILIILSDDERLG